MAKPLQNPMYGNAWFGYGAVGRWINPGAPQSPLPPPRYGFEIPNYVQQPDQQPGQAARPEGIQGPFWENPDWLRNTYTTLYPDLKPAEIEDMITASLPEDFAAPPLVNLTGSYSQPYDFSDTAHHMAEWPQFTPTEQGIVDRLGSPLVQSAFQKFEELNAVFDSVHTTLQKAGGVPVAGFIPRYFDWGLQNWQNLAKGGLLALDAGAELVERTLGFSYQALKDPEVFAIFDDHGLLDGLTRQELDTLGHAWQASSLFFDSIAPPTGLIYNTIGDYDRYTRTQTAGQVVAGLVGGATLARFWGIDWDGLSDDVKDTWESLWPRVKDHWKQVLQGGATETGGLPALVAARQAMAEGVPLEQYRDQYLADLGGLSIRSQIFDTTMHVVADPINFIMPKIAPVERTRALTQYLRYNRVAPEVSDAAASIGRIADDLAFAADVSGRVDPEKWAGELADLRRLADQSRIPELVTAARNLSEGSGSNAKALATIRGAVDRLNELGPLTKPERFFMDLFGGGVDYMKAGAGFLTPRAKASEFINNFSDNVRILIGQGDDVEQWIRVVKQGAAGAFGGTFGHMMVTPTGRHVQAVLRAYANKGDELLNIWETTAKTRQSVENVARAMGTDVVDFVTRISSKKGVQSTFDEFVDVLRSTENLDAAGKELLKQIDEGALGAETFAAWGRVFSKTKDGQIVPYTTDMFRAVLMSDMVETAAETAIKLYNVREEGVWQKAVNVVKAAESLMLLGMNPRYPVQNWWNNEVTMIARGVYSAMSMDQIKLMWEAWGWTPTRLGEGFTISGSVQDLIARGNIDAAYKAGLSALQEHVAGPATGWDRAADFFRNLTRGKDTRAFASGIESYASARAYTAGMMKAWDQVWQPGKGFTHIDNVIPGLSTELRAADPQFADFVMDAVINARKPEDITAIRTLADVRMNYETVFRKAVEDMGLNPENARLMMDHELANSVRSVIQGLGDRPSHSAIESAMGQMEEIIQRHLDEVAEASIPVRTAEYATLAEVGDPSAWGGFWGDVSRTVFERQTSHFQMFDLLAAKIRDMPPGPLKGRAWKSLFARADRDWSRTWKVTQSMFDGISEGLKKAGYSDELADSFSELYKGYAGANRSFIEARNTAWTTHYATKFKSVEAESLAYQKVLKKLDQGYAKLIDANTASWQKMDAAFMGFIGNPSSEMAAGVQAWRSQLRALRRQDMLDMLAFRRTVRDAPPAQVGKMWNEYNLNRLARQDMINQLEVRGQALLSGDAGALNYFNNLSAPYDDALIVDVMISRLTDEEVIQFLPDLAGGNKLLAELQAQQELPLLQSLDNFKNLRNVYRQQQFADLANQAGQLYPLGTPERAAAFGRLMNSFGVTDPDDTLRFTQAFFKGDYAPAVQDLRRGWETTRVTDDMWVIGYKDQAFTLNRTEALGGVEGWELTRADGTIVGRAIGEEGQQQLTAQARNMVEAQLRQKFILDNFGDRAVELNRISDVYQMPVGELDDDLAEMVKAFASDLQNQLNAGKGGEILESAAPNASVTDATGFIKTQSPASAWWGELSNQFNKKTFSNALGYIASGDDAKDFKSVAAARELIYDQMQEAARQNFDRFDGFLDLMKARDIPAHLPNPLRMDLPGTVDEIGIDDLVRALAERARVNGDGLPDNLFANLLDTEVAKTGSINNFLNSTDQVIPRQQYLLDGADDLYARYQRPLLDAMREQMHNIRATPRPQFASLPAQTQAKLSRYLERVTGEMNDARITAGKIAEGMRDAALLNYNRQYHWDAWMSNMVPFGYWYTHSAAAWLAHSIDRPAMLSTYYKMSRALDAAVGNKEGLPSRLQGKIKIPLPFAPEWMGDWYVDPLRAFGLPFEGFTQPFEQWGQSILSREAYVERILGDQLKNGEISQQQYDAAIESKNDPIWNRAAGIARENNAGNEFDLYDFMSLTTSPHLPIQWAWNAARGTPENITPLPATRTIRAVADVLGIDPGIYNSTWGNIRQALGLPAFDQWDDYRIDRELSNMVGEGRITTDEAIRAMIERGDNQLFLEAQQRTRQTQGATYLMGMLGLPVTAYPPGEENLRNLQEEYSRVMDNYYETGNPDMKDDFFEQHPEYESRLALWKSPEERLHSFLVDNLWTVYHNLSWVDRQTIKEVLGDEFDLFLAPDPVTGQRDYNAIPAEQLAVWLKMMGGDAPGTLGQDALPIRLADPALAGRAEVFFQYRNNYFPNWFELQDTWGKLEGNPERAQFLDQHPELSAYWQWRDQVLPNYDELMDAYMSQSPDSARDLFLRDYPELQAFWDQREEIFPDISVLTQQYANTPDYLRDQFRVAHPELVAYWEWRDRALPGWRSYYDYFFDLSENSQRDDFLGAHPELIGFWEQRDELFPGITDITKLYSQLPKSDARAEYLAANPELQRYWDWRNAFLKDNPDIVPFVDDDFEPNYGSAQQYEQITASQPNFTWQEWSLMMTTPLQETVIDYIVDGEPLSDAAVDQLEALGNSMGLTLEQLLAQLQGAAFPTVP